MPERNHRRGLGHPPIPTRGAASATNTRAGSAAAYTRGPGPGFASGFYGSDSGSCGSASGSRGSASGSRGSASSSRGSASSSRDSASSSRGSASGTATAPGTASGAFGSRIRCTPSPNGH